MAYTQYGLRPGRLDGCTAYVVRWQDRDNVTWFSWFESYTAALRFATRHNGTIDVRTVTE